MHKQTRPIRDKSAYLPYDEHIFVPAGHFPPLRGDPSERETTMPAWEAGHGGVAPASIRLVMLVYFDSQGWAEGISGPLGPSSCFPVGLAFAWETQHGFKVHVDT
jgi:hypothetical protein